MKRGTPLRRRSPLKASASLQRGAGTVPTGRARLAARSEKRQGEMILRRILVRDLLAARPVCEARWVCRGARAVDVHERLKRSRGGNILDPRQAHMVTLCRACHEMTEREPAEATRRRMLLPSWHDCPPVGPC
jgi:hypothetical protein